MEFKFDSDPIEPNPNPKDREPTWAFFTAGGIATARKEHRGVAPERRVGQSRDPCTSHARSLQQGTTKWPLDGCVLSLGRARTPARGRWAEPLFLSLGHRGRLQLRLFLRAALRDEREGEGENELGFRGAAAIAGFIRPK